MGKKFVIAEVLEVEDYENGKGYDIASYDDDDTWIDPRHVIDGERLREGMVKPDDTYFDPVHGWKRCISTTAPFPGLILDTPKPKEEDEWEQVWGNESLRVLRRK